MSIHSKKAFISIDNGNINKYVLVIVFRHETPHL